MIGAPPTPHGGFESQHMLEDNWKEVCKTEEDIPVDKQGMVC